MDQNQLRQQQVNERRGWIVNFLYQWFPKPIEFASIRFLLDKKNHPVSSRRLSGDLEFLRSSNLIRVFPVEAIDALDDVRQAKLIQKYCDSEGEMDSDFCAALTSHGTNFQEGVNEQAGVVRKR